MNLPFWQRTEGVRANNKRAVLVVYSKESPCLLRCTIALPKKSSVEPDAPTTVQSYGMLFCFSRRSEGVQGASEKPPLASLHANFPEGESSLRVWRADYGAVGGLPPRGGQYFLSKRKKVPKKARGTATPEAAHVAMRRGLRSAGAERLEAPNLFGASKSGP